MNDKLWCSFYLKPYILKNFYPKVVEASKLKFLTHSVISKVLLLVIDTQNFTDYTHLTAVWWYNVFSNNWAVSSHTLAHLSNFLFSTLYTSILHIKYVFVTVLFCWLIYLCRCSSLFQSFFSSIIFVSWLWEASYNRQLVNIRIFIRKPVIYYTKYNFLRIFIAWRIADPINMSF